MEARVKIQKWGSNLGISFPQILATELSLREGLYINIYDKDSKIIIEPIKPDSSYNLAEMLSRITENNIHQSVDTGIPLGNEIW